MWRRIMYKTSEVNLYFITMLEFAVIQQITIADA